MSFGPPAGSPFGGPSASATSAASGLPFAGVPAELADRAKKILDEEPDHGTPAVEFSQSDYAREPFTLRHFLGPKRVQIGLAIALVTIETLALQAGPLLTQLGVDRAILPKNTGLLVTIGVIYLAAIVVNTVIARIRIRFTGRLGEDMMRDLRIRVFSHMQRQGLEYYTGEKAGRLLTRMTSDIDALTALFQDGLVNLFVQMLTLAVITIVLLILNPTLAAITLLIVLPAMGILTKWFKSRSEIGYARVRDRIADVLADLSESLAGMRVISAHNRRAHNIINHDNVVGDYREANLYASKVGAVYGPSSEFVGVLGQAALLAIGGRMVVNGTLSVGELFAFLLYLTNFFAPIQQLVQLYNSYQQGQSAVDKLRQLLATSPSVPESPHASVLPKLEGRIEFDSVTFGYTPDASVLHDISFVVEPGETIAVVGPTGAGKSTVAKLVTRFYDPQHGAVKLDGVNIKDVTIASLRSQLGVVPQEPFLFNGTIADNVRFARDLASDAEVLEACQLVGLGDLVERLPHGINSLVHERGSSLSSGERQLLALARAFMSRPRVLLLDEATSNLDLQSETMIERALDVVLEGRTAIIIAHRLATAQRADRIAVIDEGRLIEFGTHEELLELGGYFASMHESWQLATSIGDDA